MNNNSLSAIVQNLDLGHPIEIKPVRSSDFSSPGDGSQSDIIKHKIITEEATLLHKLYMNQDKLPKYRDFLFYLTSEKFASQRIVSPEIHMIEETPGLFFYYVDGIQKKKLETEDYRKIGSVLKEFHETGYAYTQTTPMTHNDLHPGNIIFSKGLPYFIDLDDVSPGDPAQDIASLCFYAFALAKDENENTTNEAFSAIMKEYSSGVVTDNLRRRIQSNLQEIVTLSRQQTKLEYGKGLITEEKVRKRNLLQTRINEYVLPKV